MELSDEQIMEFIEGAGEYIDAVFASVTIADSLKENIKKWVAAHMIALSNERTTIQESAGGAGVSYANVFSEGLKSTPYGQFAINLDITGTLSAINEDKKRIVFKSL